MKELDLLRSMWRPKAKRSTHLIVGTVTSLNDGKGTLGTDSWAFCVPYCFRDALGLSYDERIQTKDEKVVRRYMIWTQGPLVSFKEGDTLHSKDGKRTVQVLNANPMGWNQEKGEMYLGGVYYRELNPVDGRLTETSTKGCNQMEFLELLITGRTPGTPQQQGLFD